VPMLPKAVLGREQLPHTYQLLDQITAAVGTKPIDGVVLGREVNAGYGRYGWRRRRIVTLGVPLVLALDPAERVALLGHEIGHAVNGDVGRSVVLGGAHGALISLWSVVEPDSILPAPTEGLVGFLAIPFRLIQLGIARAILGLALLQLLLCYRTSQRAEFHADAIGARIAGTRGSAAALARLHASGPASQLGWLAGASDPVHVIADRVRLTSAREIERLRRLEAIGGSRLDMTHPPTVDRERVIAALPVQPGSIVLTAGESAAIDRELDAHIERIGKELAEAAAAALG